MAVRGYVSVVWGCPYEGKVSIEKVREIVGALLEAGVYEVSLGDTVGYGNPRQTELILSTLLRSFPVPSLAVHFHDTRGSALANALVALSQGIETIDASVGGLGGCPYAPGASGNLATEDLVNMLDGMQIGTGIDLKKLVEASELAQRLVGRTLPSKVLAAVLGEQRRAEGTRG